MCVHGGPTPGSRRCTMTELRRRMVRDMTLRGFSPLTHEAYLGAVSRLAAHYRRSPDQLSAGLPPDFVDTF